MASAYLTLDYDEFYSAFNTIIELDDRGALKLATAKSKLQKPEDLEKAEKPGSITPNDSLIIYLRPFAAQAAGNNLDNERRVLQLWVRLLRIYMREPNLPSRRATPTAPGSNYPPTIRNN